MIRATRCRLPTIKKKTNEEVEEAAVEMRLSRISIAIAGSVALAALVATTSLSSAADFDWKKYSGSTVSVSLKKIPWTDVLTPFIPEFEALTGIKVKLEVLPENQHREK